MPILVGEKYNINMLYNRLEKEDTQELDSLNKKEDKKKIDSAGEYEKYTLQYLYNNTKASFQLFMNTTIYDKETNENLEKQGILLRSWNPITKSGEQYIFNKEDGEGDLNTKKVYFPNTKTIIEFSEIGDVYKESYKLAEEIMKVCPHHDIELRMIPTE